MSTGDGVCPGCGRPYRKTAGLAVHMLVGAAAGLVVGTAFVAYWFGTYAGFFHNMAIIHEVAGTLLGGLIGAVAAVWRRR
ncbi:MAG TPA: hypothetical protein ENJ37_05800 [Deltaproteobacteria bacterium]|nr:hypothetical protein [Deltaproteobacteria bacterium]